MTHLFEATVGNYKLVVDYDNQLSDPREYESNLGKLCMRRNKVTKQWNELNIDWMGEPNKVIKNLERFYYIYWLDAYIHSGITLSLHGQGTQCRFDTATKVGFIAIPKRYDEN